jgi:hypothetical protein
MPVPGTSNKSLGGQHRRIEVPMATPQQTSPISLRSVVTVTPAARPDRAIVAPDSRPYLVTSQHRKTAQSSQRYLALFPHESEDARITGDTRSLYRRLLALNLPAAPTSPVPAGVESEKKIFVEFKIA